MADDIIRLEQGAGTELAERFDSVERRHVGDAYAPNTLRAYLSDWRLFVAWCADVGVDSRPADPRAVAAYLDDLKELGRKWATIARRLASINQAHRQVGLTPPGEHEAVRRAVRALRRTLRVGSQRRVRAALPDDLRRWLHGLDESRRSARDAAIVTMGLGGALRRAEIAALTMGDIAVEGSGMLVRIAQSKTDQAGEGAEIAIWRGDRSITCPVTRWKAWLDVVRAEDGRDPDPDEPAFRAFTGAHDGMTRNGISGQTVARVVKRLAALGGDDPELYSGHSLRAGFVTAADAVGKSEAEIMKQTRHRSRAMLDRYHRPRSKWERNASEGIGL